MAFLKPLARAVSPVADDALDRVAASAGYRPNALATMARRLDTLMAVIALADTIIYQPGHVPIGLRWNGHSGTTAPQV